MGVDPGDWPLYRRACQSAVRWWRNRRMVLRRRVRIRRHRIRRVQFRSGMLIAVIGWRITEIVRRVQRCRVRPCRAGVVCQRFHRCVEIQRLQRRLARHEVQGCHTCRRRRRRVVVLNHLDSCLLRHRMDRRDPCRRCDGLARVRVIMMQRMLHVLHRRNVLDRRRGRPYCRRVRRWHHLHHRRWRPGTRAFLLFDCMVF